jgi:hypothetical protein
LSNTLLNRSGRALPQALIHTHRFCQLDAVHPRHHVIGDDQLRTFAFENAQGLLPAAGSDGQVAFIFQREAQYVGDEVFIIDNQNRGHATLRANERSSAR